ncbi:hypothetical protein K9M79_05165 [Candidatus Woesearchaeota archaeon]|nr:hypothetical protein [Candidatus Woesearchaeota archaeon]
MKPIKTDDGSYTFFSEQYGEHYHSITGADEESMKKFVEPAVKIIESRLGLTNSSLTSPTIYIIDVCFGLGYNSAAFLDYLGNIIPTDEQKIQIHIAGLENDQEIIDKIKANDSSFKSYPIIKKLASDGIYSKNNIKIELHMGDARITVKDVPKNWANLVFLDPFSPKKCPQLWTEEFFRNIYERMSSNSCLTTYSCARSVRDNLRAVGFEVVDGPRVGRRAPSTIAYKR